MTAPVAITKATTSSLLGLRRLIGFGVLAVFPAGIFFLASRTASDIARAEGFTGLSLDVFLAVVVPIVTVVISGSALGSERRGNTLSFLMLRPISRFSIAASKLAAAIAASFAITALGALALGIQGSLALDDFGHLFALLVATLIATVGYAAIFVPVGYLTERATLMGFIYIFVWETAMAGIVTGLSGTSLWRVAASAFVGLAPPDLDIDLVDASIGSLAPGAGGAALKMLVLAAISIGLTGWLLRSRDLT